MVTTTDPIIFQPYIDKQQLNYYYKAIITEDENSIHYIFLYTIGLDLYKEPKKRWILIDLIEYKVSEDREYVNSIIKHTQALDSMHEILSYVGDIYNTSVKFKDLPQES